MKPSRYLTTLSRILLIFSFLISLLRPDSSALAISTVNKPLSDGGAAWMTQSVWQAQGPSPMSMVVDPAGIIHIAYYSSSNSSGLHHAWFDGVSWQDESIDTITGSAVDMALGGDGLIYILYDDASSALKLATYNGLSWSTSAIFQESPYQQKEYGSLAVDDNGALHVSFFNRRASLYYGVRTASTWQFTQVQDTAGRQTSIAIDAQGYPQISFCAVNDICAGLRHAAFNGSAWTTTNITTGDGFGAYSQLAYGADGLPVIAAYEAANQAVKLFRKGSGGAWSEIPVQTNVGDGGPLGLAVDNAGTIHLAYYLQSSGDLRFATYTTALNVETAASTNDVGSRPALTLDAAGAPLVAHQDSSNLILLTSHNLGADLRVADVWTDNGKISFQVINAGLTPTSVTSARVIVDSAQIGLPIAINALKPGDRQTVNLVSAYTCGAPSDAIQVQVDYSNLVMESDETNNSPIETWLCNNTPLRILSGPAISNIQNNSATFTWTTSITADSYVGVATRRGQAYTWTGPGAFDTSHSVTITGLLPNTTYGAVARSTKKGYPEIEVVSRPVYFTTLPAVITPPSGAGQSITRSNRSYESYNLISSLTNTANVARMDFLIDDNLVGSDYTPNNQGRFELEYFPAASGISRMGWYGSGHTLTTRAVLANGQTLQQSSPFNAMNEPMEINLSFGQPSSGHILPTAGASMPTGSVLPVSIFAEEYGWRCSIHGGGPADPDSSPALCADQAAPVTQLKLVLDDDEKKIFTIAGKTYFQENLAVGGLAVGSHKLTAIAIASDGTQETLDLPFNVVKTVVTPLVAHTGFVEENIVVVEAAITNPSTSPFPIEINKVYETAHGLQWAAQTYSDMTVKSEYDPETRTNLIVFERTANKVLAPGQSMTIRYELAPILYEDQQNITYWLNKGYLTVLNYTVQGINSVIGVPSELPVLNRGGSDVSFDVGVRLAFPKADYLIVTNTDQLFNTFDETKVNGLLSKMGELAATKQGVLAYLDTYDDGSILNGLIAEGSPWLGRLSPVFEGLVDGYVLLVGDLRIIASDRSMSLYMPNIDEDDYKRVHHTDNRYAHTQGDGRPDLVVSRLIGSIDTMITSLQTSLDVYNGANGRHFNKSDASFVSGSEPHEKAFESSVRTLRDTASGAHNELYFDYQSALWYYPFNYEEFDGVASCDVDDDGDEELIHGDRSTDKIAILNPKDGAIAGVISQDFEEGDGLTCGDVDNDGYDEIIFGDRADKIIVYDFHTGGSTSFTWDFMAYDQLAAGDLLVTNPGEEIVMADRDDKIFVLSANGSLLLSINLQNYNSPIDFMEGDKVAVGDVVSFFSGTEIVITSRAANQVIVLNTSGMIIQRFDLDIEYGDDLAVGSPLTGFGGLEEIIIGDRSNYISVYQVVPNGNDIILYRQRSIHSDFEMNDRITTARVNAGDTSATLMEFMRDDQISALDIIFPDYGLDQLYENMNSIGADLLMFRGHGNSGGWADVMTSGQVRDFGSLAPVVAGITCLSGDYPDLVDHGIAASALKHGAGLYIGATEVSYSSYNSQMAPMFLTRFYSSRLASADWTHLERKIWGYSGEFDYYYYYVYEYNLYGETKFGKTGPTLTPSAVIPTDVEASAVVRAADTQVVDIPNYVRLDENGTNTFTLPDGGQYSVNGEPLLPTYSFSIDYPAGTLVQDVSLSSQALKENLQGIVLPVFDHAVIDGVRPAGLETARMAVTTGAEPGWLPALDQPFKWQVTQHSDGSSTLEILIYPMRYAPATQTAQFYNQFTFNVTTAPTSIAITDLQTDQPGYNLGAPVGINMIVENSGAQQDLNVVAEIRRSRGTAALSSVPFAQIKGLQGMGIYSANWDSTGLPPGAYTLDVRLYNTSNQLLAQRTVDFNLGQAELEIQNLTSTTKAFKTGDAVGFSFQVTNPGDEALDGLAYITILGPDGYVQEMSSGLNPLNPGDIQNVSLNWDTSGVPDGKFNVNVYASFASRISLMQSLELANQHSLFLPVTIR